jgi:CelD/BcsL family acetyltransferase involved in cellulose biosynthesis
MVRQALRKSNDVRSFERISAEEQIDEFLAVAVAINQKTYQWKLGLRLRSDDAERRDYLRLAQQGQLRCYVLRIDGIPCAFIRGILVRNMYLYQASGFLPEYAKWSPGKIALTLAIKDLVEADGCQVFDFGDVGDRTSYKSQFGNAFMPSRKILISKRFSIRPTLTSMAQRTLLELKNMGKWILANENLRRGLRQFLGT